MCIGFILYFTLISWNGLCNVISKSKQLLYTQLLNLCSTRLVDKLCLLGGYSWWRTEHMVEYRTATLDCVRPYTGFSIINSHNSLLGRSKWLIKIEGTKLYLQSHKSSSNCNHAINCTRGRGQWLDVVPEVPATKAPIKTASTS